MSSVNEWRDRFVQADPNHAGLIMSRDQIVEKWCQDHGKDKDHLSIDDILKIRALPEWQKAG